MPVKKYTYEKLRFPFVDTIERTVETDDDGKIIQVTDVNLSKEQARQQREETRKMKEIQRQEAYDKVTLPQKILAVVSLIVIIVSLWYALAIGW